MSMIIKIIVSCLMYLVIGIIYTIIATLIFAKLTDICIREGMITNATVTTNVFITTLFWPICIPYMLLWYYIS